MPDLKLLRIEQGDSQKNLADKVNQNFSDIIAFGGGPYGKVGKQGPQGDQGITGPVGPYGSLGYRGSIWTVGPTQPSATGGFNGDYWINPENFNSVYILNSGSWSPYGFNLLGQDLFRIYEPVTTSSGNSTYSGYYISSINPQQNTLVLSDNIVANDSVTANPQYSKVVISIDGGATGKNLMEFTKSEYVDNTSFRSSTPRFFWSDRSLTNYNLSFLSGGSLFFDLSSNLSLQSKAFGYNLNFRSSGMILNLNSSLGFSARSSGGNIILDFKTTGTANFSAGNIRYSSSLFTMPVNFVITSQSTDSLPALWLSNSNSSVSGFRHKSNIQPNRSSRLFRAYDVASASSMFEVLGDGEVYLNRKVSSIQPSQSVSKGGTGTVYIGATSSVSVGWYAVIPTIAITSSVTNTVNCNNGSNFVITPTSTGPSSATGIYLWTPSTGGGINTNPGWLNLINNQNSESISFTVRTDSESRLVRFIGLGLGQTYNVLPPGEYISSTGNGGFVDLTGNNSIGASHIDFTIINLYGQSAVANNRWFKVYYSAYGGNLGSVKCGVLYTPPFSAYINTGSIYMTDSSLSQTLPFSSTILATGTPITPGQSRNFTPPSFPSGSAFSATATFSSAPTTVTATLIRYPSGTSTNGTISGSGTSRTITWSGIDLSTSTAYVVRIGGS
jgi:hypothetical protein